MSNQITTIGTNLPQHAFYPVNSRHVYECANSSVSRGVTGIPQSIQECLRRFPGVRNIAEAVGFFNSKGASFGWATTPSGTSYAQYISGGYTLWSGNTSDPPANNVLNSSAPVDMFFSNSSDECLQVQAVLNDTDWFGCLWGTPSAPYSCTCPDIGPKYEAYIKHRLNVASFWNTPVETPVKRTEFVDALQYGRKIDVTVAGDFNLKIGQVVNMRLDGVSNFPYASRPNYLNGLYYITGIKHVITNSGTHETALALSTIALDYTGKTSGVPYYS